eukprot:1324056-Amorphochlora_amoeboformis.AAC.1
MGALIAVSSFSSITVAVARIVPGAGSAPDSLKGFLVISRIDGGRCELIGLAFLGFLDLLCVLVFMSTIDGGRWTLMGLDLTLWMLGLENSRSRASACNGSGNGVVEARGVEGLKAKFFDLFACVEYLH